MTGTIFNIMRFAVNDGPGIRTTVFLKGCPLACAWCHNPEGLTIAHEVAYRQDRCAHCGACIEACPEHALSEGVTGVQRAQELCVACGTCAGTCVTGAREEMGREITVDALMRELVKDRVFYDESGGGVTFSGGEPLLQYEFLMEALTACRTADLRTAVETTGFASWEKVRALIPLTDLFLYDVKLMDGERHRQFTGVSNTRILENLRALADAGAQVTVRVPLVPGVNDDEENIRQIARFVADLGTVPSIHLLPFHAGASGKYHALGMEYTMEGMRSPSPASLQSLASLITAHGVAVHIGG
jgi:pyruvate formate lyase activating enzyme